MLSPVDVGRVVSLFATDRHAVFVRSPDIAPRTSTLLQSRSNPERNTEQHAHSKACPILYRKDNGILMHLASIGQ
jgi:hypothetical protein